MAMREGLWEDVEHDPSFKKQRLVGQYGLAILINVINGYQPWGSPERTPEEHKKHVKELAKHVLDKAVLVGLITFDDMHHAPACPANRWSGMVVPEGPCSCGTERALKYPVVQK